MRLSYNTANILLGACLLLLHLAMATSQGPADSQAAAKVPLMLENQSEGDVTTLDMSSGSASVELGPVVVNEDGTLSRITNWLKMSESERKTTLRVLAKRNKSRLEALKAREAGQSEEATAATSTTVAATSISTGGSTGSENVQGSSHDEL